MSKGMFTINPQKNFEKSSKNVILFRKNLDLSIIIFISSEYNANFVHVFQALQWMQAKYELASMPELNLA